jgi:hypothetical protein
MSTSMLQFLQQRIRKFFADRFAKIAEINRKYRKPRITTTWLVKSALLLLRVYLLALVGLLVYKFITLLG